MDLQFSTRQVGERAVVEVIGEVDLDTAPQLGEQALSALNDISRHLVVDLSQVGFMDSTGLKVLLATQRRATLADGSFVLVGATRPVRRILELTGLDQALHLYDSLDDIPSVASMDKPIDGPTNGPVDGLTDAAAPTP